MTDNPTSDDLGFDQIVLVPRDLGVTVYAEVIIIDPLEGLTGTGESACCDESTYSTFSIQRDLIVPTDVASVKGALNLFSRRMADYDVYYRDFNTNTLVAGDYADEVANRRSLVFMSKLLSSGKRSYALNHLGTSREILPARVPR